MQIDFVPPRIQRFGSPRPSKNDKFECWHAEPDALRNFPMNVGNLPERHRGMATSREAFPLPEDVLDISLVAGFGPVQKPFAIA